MKTDLAGYVNSIVYSPMNKVKSTYSAIDLGTW